MGVTTTGSTNYPTSSQGTTTILPNAASAQGTLSAQKIVITGGGATIQSISIYFGSVGNGTGQIQYAFYTDNAGLPSSLIAGSTVGPQTATLGWMTLTYTTPLYLQAGTYWLARQVSNDQPIRRYAATGGPGRARRPYSWGAFPSSFGTPDVTDNLNENQYITYVLIEGYSKSTKATLGVNNANFVSVSFYSHAAGNVRLAIYSNVSNAPSSLLWSCGSTAATVGGWKTVNISAGTPGSLTLNSGTYWLAWQWDSPTSGPSYTAGIAGDGNYIILPYGSFPASWSGGTSSSEKWSMYATYCIAPTATITGSSNVSCYAGSDGTITITASGGTPPYTYSIDNGNDGYPYSGTSPKTITGLSAGILYKIRVKDSNGCESQACP